MDMSRAELRKFNDEELSGSVKALAIEPGKRYLIDSTGKSNRWKAAVAAAWPTGVEAHFVDGLPSIELAQ